VAGGKLRPLRRAVPSVVVQDRADATVLGERRTAAEIEQVEVKRLAGLPLAVALDFDRDGLRRLAGGEGAVAETCAELQAEADEAVCARTPRPFYAVGQWYEDFSQTTDEEVRDLLAQAAAGPAPAGRRLLS